MPMKLREQEVMGVLTQATVQQVCRKASAQSIQPRKQPQIPLSAMLCKECLKITALSGEGTELQTEWLSLLPQSQW